MLSILIMGWLAAYAWRNRHVKGALPFVFINILGTWGAFTEFFSILSSSPETASLFYNARFITL